MTPLQSAGLCASPPGTTVMPGEELAPGPVSILAGVMSIPVPVPTVIQERTLHRAVHPGSAKTGLNKTAQKAFS